MKKTMAGAALAGIVLRLAVLAGAGDALKLWVSGLGWDARTVAAALELEMGGFPAAERQNVILAAGDGFFSVNEAAVPVISLPAAEGMEGGDGGSEEVRPEETEAPALAALRLAEQAAVLNRTSLKVDTAALAREGPGIRLKRGEPQILIIHTHSSEAFTPDGADRYEASDPYRTEDKRYSVIRVGDTLAEQLEAQGLTVLHDRELYDYPSYTGSYNRSGASVERYLESYPSIRIVIDLHRDAIGSGDTVYKTHADLDGPACAQVMLLVGTGENGLPHPDWRENLKLALYLQGAADSRWPGLTRPIALVSERYNQQLCRGSLILEVGSTGNTLREALLAAERFGTSAGAALAALLED